MDTTIEYIISSNGEISPITPQPGGVLGDDNTVTLSVDLSAVTIGEKEYIRIDIANGSGGFFSSEHLTVGNGKVTYRLPYEVTSAGGTAQAHLVIVEYDGGVNKIRYSFPMRIYFKDSSAGTAGYALYSKDLSGLMLKTKEEADRANECSAAAQSLMEESQRQATAAANSATAAEAAYSGAADSAVRAASSADNAANYAAAAASKADSAKSSADNAADSADEANRFSAAAQSLMEESQRQANAATTAATAAEAAYSSAADSAISAQSSADNAAASEANVANAISAHNADSEAHGALFGSVNSALSGISGALSAAVEKGNSTADTVALLQKYPCYEYTTSGGAVQRFDEVSLIPHNIGVTVHGATDENGNSVTNPTVSVYGKNMHVFNYKNIRGYTFSGSNCKIVNPTQFSENPNNSSILLPAGTYTFSCNISGSREYASKSNFSAFYMVGDSQYNIDMNNFVSGTAMFKTRFTVTKPTNFLFRNVWFIETPTSADLSLDFQLEVGSTATDYEPYTEPQTANPSITIGEGEVFKVETFNAVSPTMTVVATDDNALVSVVDVTYNRDVGKALGNLQAAIAALA